MLSLSLILSAILLVIVNRAVWRSDRSVFPAYLGGALIVFCPAGMMIVLPALLYQALFLMVIATAWCLLGFRPRTFLLLSCTATLVAYAIVGWSTYQKHAQLREHYAYVSMDDRLPPRKSARTSGPLPATTEKRLTRFEKLVWAEDSTDPVRLEEARSADQRVGSLKQLHEDAVNTFINQDGFGFTRMSGVSEWALKQGLRTEPPPPQPAPRSTDSWSASALLDRADAKEAEMDQKLLQMHFLGVVDFVNPNGFGFVKDRQHVSGFQSHQFSRLPDPGTAWRLKTLDLVGLVVHEEPVAYVSATLPRMDRLRKTPTRPLDAFEVAGLAALRKGQDLFVRDTANGHRRMLGAVRSGKQCLSCHGGERGELLGAFSYTLARGQP